MENNNIPPINNQFNTQPNTPINFQMEKKKKPFNMLIVPLVVVILLLGAAIFMAVSSNNKYQEQKNNVQAIVDKNVTQAKKEQKISLDKEYDEKSKLPYVTYEGPSELGSVKITYPRSWSAMYNQGGSNLFSFYAHPSIVPSPDLKKKFALRVAITDGKYQDALSGYEKQTKNKNITISPYQVSGVTGARIDGEINKDEDGSLVVFPVRDKVLYVWTQDKTYINDFNDIVLKNLSFIP